MAVTVESVKSAGEPAKKLIFGRDALSWTKLLGFYAVFYAVLIGIFAAFVTGFSGNLPVDKPKSHGRALQTPGLAYMPMLDFKTYSERVSEYHRDIDQSAAFVYKR